MKAAEIRELSVEDLKDKITEMSMKQEKLTLTHAVSPLENPLQLNFNRKVIARLKTELRSRELASKNA